MPCCGHDTHRWIHAKAALRAVDVAEPGRCQRSRVLPGVAEVEDGDATTWIEHAHDLAGRRGPPRNPGNVVQGHAGDDHVEGLLVERQLAGVATSQLDPLGDPSAWALAIVAAGSFAGLVLGAPQVQPDSTPGCDRLTSGPAAVGRGRG
jgi:hypothetical protein